MSIPMQKDLRAAVTCGSFHFAPVHGEFVLMQPLAFGIDRDSVSASGTI
jgi:hypothetical protein